MENPKILIVGKGRIQVPILTRLEEASIIIQEEEKKLPEILISNEPINKEFKSVTERSKRYF